MTEFIVRTIPVAKQARSALLGAVALVVLGTTSMAPLRIGRPRMRATCVIEAEAGAFERWRLRPGDRLEIR